MPDPGSSGGPQFGPHVPGLPQLLGDDLALPQASQQPTPNVVDPQQGIPFPKPAAANSLSSVGITSSLQKHADDTPKKRRRITPTQTLGLATSAPPIASSSSNLARMTKFARKRSLAACEVCRARKTKCDNQRPSCGSCLRIGSACSYMSTSSDYSPFDAGTLAILDRINYVAGLLESSQSAPSNHVPAVAPSTSVVQTPQSTVASDDPFAFHGFNEEMLTSYESLELLVNNHSCSQEILEWPIFGHVYSRKDIDVALFNPYAPSPFGKSGSDAPPTGTEDLFELQTAVRSACGTSRGMYEEDCPSLVQSFLANVHTKNPILDAKEIIMFSKHAAENGFGWNSKTCLLLLACALGAISMPFDPERSGPLSYKEASENNSICKTKDYPRAEKYYIASQKRIGLLRNDIIGAQCYFLCGVYEMYSFRPLEALVSFGRACNMFQLFALGKAGGAMSCNTGGSTLRSIEHRLYWSCLKSECEIRSFIAAPPSGISRLEYPSFPTLPSSPAADVDSSYGIGDAAFQQSWLYYLAEISARRILNRVINSFYNTDHNGWLEVNRDRIVRIATELESQAQQWEYHIPEAVRWQERELPRSELAIHLLGRAFDLYEHIYRPFLFIAIHEPEDMPQDPRIMSFVQKCLDLSCRLVDYIQVTVRHRHHGTWFSCRAHFATALRLLAAVKSGRVEVPERWPEVIGVIISALTYWESEAPDITRAKHILLGILTSMGRQDVVEFAKSS